MKVLYILRGLPGSGKSTLARTMVGHVCSADDYFVGADGVYRWDPQKLGAAHLQCRAHAHNLMVAGVECIIVDNTNLSAKEREPYERLAREYGYSVVHVTVGNMTDVETYAARNVHEVPLDTIRRMARRFQM